MKKPVVITLSLSLLALAGLTVFALQKEETTPPAGYMVKAATQVDEWHVVSNKLGESIQATPGVDAQTQPTTKSLGDAYANASNLYAFAQYAKQHPEQGGLTYAYSLARACTGFLDSLDHKPPVSPDDKRDDPGTEAKRQIATSRINQKCEGFARDNTKEPILKDIYTNTKATEKDPYFGILGNPMAAQNLIRSTRDTYLLETVLLAASPMVNTGDTYGRYFKGEVLTGADRQLFEMAGNLAACQLGTGCKTGDDLLVVSTCAFGGICADSREALYKAQIAEEKMAGGEAKLMRYRDMIVSAAKTGDISVYTQKK
ncbi:hypothetical protein FNU76_06310 [Chitinimonas arctica]|uniref:Uncharacterized protein n=1 Tax=Chitinimonas arctica TaxID=2594795 RepID=A0A516SCX2_9NEIS|nr:hypothetical protein [Chitinimonas arctica]QDQ25995.1 hypothetical protein FNU76_06310 [Chitinimonas arctica]